VLGQVKRSEHGGPMKPHIREVFKFFFFLPKMILLEREFLETVAIAGGFRFCGGIFLGGWYPKGCPAKRMVLKRFSHAACLPARTSWEQGLKKCW